MKKQYTYRAYPTGYQQWMLGRSLGCARAVFNDFIKERDRLHKAGRAPVRVRRWGGRG